MLSKNLFVLSVSSVLTFGLRFIWFNAVGYDEGIYLLISRLFSEGTMIYRDIPVHKPPMIFVINAVLTAFSSDLFLARLSIVAISVLSSFLMYYITLSLTKNSKISFLACILFSIFSSLPLSEIFLVLTEQYAILFEIGALFCLVKARTNESARNFVFAGILVGCALLTRQTAALFLILCFSFCLFWKHKGYFRDKKIFFHSFFGLSIPILLVILFFGYFGSLGDMVYQTTVWAYTDATAVIGLVELRQLWFFEYFISSSPLWFLAAFALLMQRDSMKTDFARDFIFFLFLWAVSIVAFYRLFFGPGYHHEYSETLAPLSILASLGIHSVNNINNRMKNIKKTTGKLGAIKKIKFLNIFLIVVLLVLLCNNSLNYNMMRGEVFTDDYTIITEVSYYITKNTQTTDKLLVFETQHGKIGPLIYFESNRKPIWLERGFNPLGITAEERDKIIEMLTNNENVEIVIIGGRPPLQYENGNYVYDYLIDNYVIEKEFGYYTPYPGSLENLSVTLLRDIREVNLISALELDLSNIKGATYQIENNTLILSDIYFPGYTIFYPFNTPANLSSLILSMQIMGENEYNTLYIDLVDENGFFARHEITYFSDWHEIKIPINYRTFTSSKNQTTDLQKIKQINLVFKAENKISLRISQMSLFKIDE
jgi:4-amino-4-deoxy-L-arabinose transferase-like glycosyltransferase